MTRITISSAVAAFALTAAAATAIADPGATVAHADLGPYAVAHTGVVVGTGVTAETHLVRTPSGRTVVRITAQGLQPGGGYAVHVHYGACTDYLGHFQYQHPGPGTRENEVWLDLDANADGRASDQVQVESFDLGQPLSLVMHQHANGDVEAGLPGARIACGNLALGT